MNLKDIRNRAAQFSFFTIAILIALAGQPIAAMMLSGLSVTGLVDFAVADPGASAAFYVLLAVYCLQAIVVFIAIARSGIGLATVAAGLASLLFALALLMIFYVSLACDLYGACL